MGSPSHVHSDGIHLLHSAVGKIPGYENFGYENYVLIDENRV